MPTPAIEIENLTKDYPYGFLHLKTKRSLESLSMQVQTGDVFGFLGPNGAGKSTTIKLLMRLIFPTSGTARILGKSIEDVSMHRDVGYLPEQPYFYDYLTATELLDYFARFHGLQAADRQERVQRMLKKVGARHGQENSAEKVLEGNAAKGRASASYPARSASSGSGRADVWTGSARTARGSGHYSRIEERRPNRAVFDAHPVGRGNVV